MSKFAKDVRHALIDKGMTMSQLADALGVSTAYISEILKGTRKAEAQRTKIMEYLGIVEGGEDEEEVEDDDC